MIYKIIHRSTYRYKYQVSVGNHVTCLKPRSSQHQKLVRMELDIQPRPAMCTERVDFFGNRLCFFTVQELHKELVVEARSEVVLKDQATPWPRQAPAWEEVAQSLPWDHSHAGLDAYQFAFESPRIRIRPEFASYAFQSFTPGRPMPEALLDLTARINRDFRFDSKVTNVRTPPEEVFRKRRGGGAGRGAGVGRFRAGAPPPPPRPTGRGGVSGRASPRSAQPAPHAPRDRWSGGRRSAH